MLSVQSLQTLRGAAAAQGLQSRPRRESYITGQVQSYAFSRAQAVPNSLCQSRAAPSFGLANPQRSRAAWIAQLCSAFNDAV